MKNTKYTFHHRNVLKSEYKLASTLIRRGHWISESSFLKYFGYLAKEVLTHRELRDPLETPLKVRLQIHKMIKFINQPNTKRSVS